MPRRKILTVLVSDSDVSRGGSWRHQIKFSRCAARSSLSPSFKYADYGFRVALTLGR
jgi:formylglycine-generating enzyme required for sulfatase activity